MLWCTKQSPSVPSPQYNTQPGVWACDSSQLNLSPGAVFSQWEPPYQCYAPSQETSHIHWLVSEAVQKSDTFGLIWDNAESLCQFYCNSIIVLPLLCPILLLSFLYRYFPQEHSQKLPTRKYLPQSWFPGNLTQDSWYHEVLEADSKTNFGAKSPTSQLAIRTPSLVVSGNG